MQLRKTVMMLTALSALSVVMTGCPGEEEGSLDCTTDANCLEGEIWAVLDEGETLMRPGDVLIQRGTYHAWSNRSAGVCRVAFVLIDAETRRPSRLLTRKSLFKRKAAGTEGLGLSSAGRADSRLLLRDENWPVMAFVENRLAGDPTNWWVPSAGAVPCSSRTTVPSP